MLVYSATPQMKQATRSEQMSHSTWKSCANGC